MKMTLPVVIALSLAIFLAVVTAVVFIPGVVWHPPETIIAHPYTDAQARGRKVFYSNGCNYCHTQYVRYYDSEFGYISQGGNYAYDSPMILGSERTGPDLSYIGRKRDTAWEIQHWKDPRSLSPMSIMPNFSFLTDQELQDLGEYINNLGDRVAAEWMILPPLEYSQLLNPIVYPTVKLSSGNPQGWDSWNAVGLQEGKTIYIKNCQTCHGCSGNGLGTYAGTKVVTPINFKAKPQKDMPDDQWIWHVSEGVPGSVMPPWKLALTDEQRWKVINYIWQEFAQPVEHDPQEGDPSGPYANLTNPIPLTVDVVEEGKMLFIRECWICHGDAGKGEGIYNDGIRPIPPDFSDKEHYDTFTDSDYFWRISEGLPWTAMPVWKNLLSEQERWKLVHFIRVNFTQTEKRPKSDTSQAYPGNYLSQSMPVTQPIQEVLTNDLPNIVPLTPSWDYGRNLYLKICAHCHGLTGLGDGWDAVGYLDVKPANFHSADARGLSDGDWFARVSLGIQNSAMPTWNEWLPTEYRWDAIKFIQDEFVSTVPSTTVTTKTPTVPSYFNGEIAANYITISSTMYIQEIGPISTTHGGTLYTTYCVVCHGDNGQGKGSGTKDSVVPSPAPFPTGMPEQYVYWRIAEGIPNTIMYPFNVILTEQDIYDLTSFMESKGWGKVGGMTYSEVFR